MMKDSLLCCVALPVNFPKENCEYPMELEIIDKLEGKCRLLFVNNSVNSIHLQPDQLIPEVEFKLEEPKITIAMLSDQKHDHESAALINDQWTKLEEEKLQTALKKMTKNSNIDREDRKIAIKSPWR
uniref:Uncharacterized protein n=1 Tax=Romanomermis culicivorax TaxID=13658 RepID=A0A915HEY4_ROMCU